MLKKVGWPENREYRSGDKHEPIEFYLNAIANSTKADLLLGYFSFATVNLLALGFAKFLHNGGVLRVVANNVLSQNDQEVLGMVSEDIEEEQNEPIDLTDISNIASRLSKYGKHFFKCIAWLIQNNRIELVLVRPKGKKGIAHYKSGVFSDGENEVGFKASCNFTPYGMLENLEQVDVFLSWENSRSSWAIKSQREYFESIINQKNFAVEHIDASEIQTQIVKNFGNVELDELLVDEERLIKFKKSAYLKKGFAQNIENLKTDIEEISSKPRFPFPAGPREYQLAALESWINNKKSGVFAMATGTGKTITSLNCALHEYKQEGSYKLLILVPSISLLNQWVEEVRSFNFNNILKVGGGNNWEQELASYVSNLNWGIESDLVIISTYGSFTTRRFQKYLLKIQKHFLLIADEAHNMGASEVKSVLPQIDMDRKIALSATPERVYDPIGTESINKFFNDKPPYTYEFGMARALKEGFLCEYNYYPRIVTLENEELKAYEKISKQLARYFDSETGKFKDDPIVYKLLLNRKRIIHKAKRKEESLKSILLELGKADKLKYVFTYVPEGMIIKDEEETPIINTYIKAAASILPKLKMNTYTSHDDDLPTIKKGFEEGKIDMLMAMKMLDEGVDIPRAEIGIFCSSTGNPRQFIQRRGRLLRNHQDKAFATIYDMIVTPNIGGNLDNFRMEQSLVKNELRRVAYFASLAMNYYETIESLAPVLSRYELNIDQIISEL